MATPPRHAMRAPAGTLALAWARIREAARRFRSGRFRLRPPEVHPARRALTMAAMALPGVAIGADVNDAYLQYSLYEEGGRSRWRGPAGETRAFAPLRVESLHGGTGLRLTERLKLAFDFLQDTWSGATPILSAPEAFMTVTGASAYPVADGRADRRLVPFTAGSLATRAARPGLVHMMTAASAETRKQGDLGLLREWDDASLELGAGVSDEPDFRSRFGRVNATFDFDRKRTTLSASASYTSSEADANLGPRVDWIDYGRYAGATSGPTVVTAEQGGLTIQRFKGERRDWSAGLGLKQVLGKNTTLSVGAGFQRNSGFLENPYKLVMLAFADPSTPPPLFGGLWLARVFNVAENRPDSRSQWNANIRLSHYFAPVAAAAHADYRFAQDDWGVRSHTLELLWSQGIGEPWLITPRLRYYTQSAAEFYRPYFIFARRAPVEGDGTLDFSRVPLQHYASDHRLSAYGAASAGLTLRRQFPGGLRFETGLEYYVHRGGLRAGGGGEDGFADYRYWMVNAGLVLDLEARAGKPDPGGGDGEPDAEMPPGHHHPASGPDDPREGHEAAPAGLMYGHMMPAHPGVMVGYRYMLSRQSGSLRRGSRTVPDAEVTAGACQPPGCDFAPARMVMHMHMLDLMIAPHDRVNLMAMLQYMDMGMHMRPLEGTVVSDGGVHSHGGHDRHGSGGLGDTSLAALFRLWRGTGHQLHASLALSVPTGAVDLTMSHGDSLDYGMQLGSGTWDLHPSLTYTGAAGRWRWGAQASTVRRTSRANRSGYALGAVSQATAWIGREVAPGVTLTLRGLRTVQGAIRGEFDGPSMSASPTDHPRNYGGRFADAGLGIAIDLPGGGAHGERLQVEWLHPLRDRPNGYQLERQGTLWVSWTAMFP